MAYIALMDDTIEKGLPQVGSIQKFGLLGSPPFSGEAQIVYLCDGCSRPASDPPENCRQGETLAWDGQTFLPITKPAVSSHTASYRAVQAALRDALVRQLVRVELHVTSDLVYRQLITGAYCRASHLNAERHITVNLASKVGPVRIALVTHNFQIGPWRVDTRRRLRCVNRQFALTGGSLDVSGKTCGC